MLTNAEQNVQQMLLKGLSNKEISVALNIAEKTVKYHLTNVYKKNNVTGDRQLMAKMANVDQFVQGNT